MEPIVSSSKSSVFSVPINNPLSDSLFNTAVEGIDTLRALVAQAAGRIELMAGSGVNPSNVRQLAATGVDAVHFSARSVRPGGMVFRNPHVSMGDCGDVSEYDLLCADERLIRQILTLLEP